MYLVNETVFRITGLLLLSLLVGLGLLLRVRYGGSQPYPDLAQQPPLVPADSVEAFFGFPQPVGNVAATPAPARRPRVFFTVHPESRPEGGKLLEINANGQAAAYPDAASQAHLLTPLGVYCDQQQRLWVIDHGNHGFDGARLLAFDLATNRLVEHYIFPAEVAPKGSFLNDLCVSPDGRYVFVADVSFFGKAPSLVVYDVAHRSARALLHGDSTVTA